MNYKGYKSYSGYKSYKSYSGYKGYSSCRGYKDYKKLDVTKETASEEENRKLKRKVCVSLIGVDALIFMSSLLIANIVPISSTLQTIMSIIGITTLALFLPLMYMVVKFQPKK